MIYHCFDWGFKLLRGGVVEDCKTQFCRFQHRILQGDDKHQALLTKVEEETLEFITAPNFAEQIKEAADLIEVRLALQSHNWLTPVLADQLDQTLQHMATHAEAIEAARLEKRAKKGSFDDGHAIGIIHIPEGNPWLKGFFLDREKYRYLGVLEGPAIPHHDFILPG